MLHAPTPAAAPCAPQEYAGRLKVVKVEADPNPAVIEQYKVRGGRQYSSGAVQLRAVQLGGRAAPGVQEAGGVIAKLIFPFLHPPPNPPTQPPPQVYGLPCLIVFKDGQPVEESHHEGAVTKKALVEYLAKHGVPATANA